MMTNFASLIIGIASSLVATAIFIGLSEFARRVLIPWFEDKIYRGVRVDGKWEYVKEGDQIKIYSYVDLVQRGDRIQGVYSHQVDEEEPVLYKLKGTLRDSYLSATNYPMDKHFMDAGCFLLHVHSSNGMRLEGALLALSSKDGAVTVCDGIEFKRKES